MMPWGLFAAMSLVAIAFAVWPLYRRRKTVSPLIVGIIVGVVALSSGLYYLQGRSDVPSGAGVPAETQHINEDAVAALANRLQSNPDDADGWVMLGRSYSSLGNYSGADEAFERAMKVDPDNPQALFFAGIAASNRNDLALAADRWERLLGLNPPPEIEGVLRRSIAEWRGEEVPQDVAAAVEPLAPPAEVPEGMVVAASLSLSAAARSALGGDANVFIIARDPGQPSPPIAVTRRPLRELPTVVYLGDAESMVAGRDLSGFAEFELIARVSLSGQPNAQSGDWFGTVMVQPAESSAVTISISQQVP